MDKNILHSKTLEQWKETMETNGYSYYNEQEFIKKSDKPCYIAENADNVSDIYSYVDMYNETLKFIQNNWKKVSMAEGKWWWRDTLSDEEIQSFVELLILRFFNAINSRFEFFPTFLNTYYVF